MVVITGASDGIGAGLARQLTARERGALALLVLAARGRWLELIAPSRVDKPALPALNREDRR